MPPTTTMAKARSRPRTLRPRIVLAQPPDDGLVLVQRDYQILQALSDAPMLTVPAIEWLFFPTWRARWAAWHERVAAARSHGVPEAQLPTYRPTTACYSRMQRLHDTGYVARIRRTVAISAGDFERVEDVFLLAPKGARALHERTGRPIGAFYTLRQRERSVYTIEHTMQISRIYAALTARFAEGPGLALTGWRGDHLTATDAGRLPVPETAGSGRTRWLQPDGAFWRASAKGRVLFFVENDRERSVESWVDKITRYIQAFGSPGLAERYDGATTFALLAVTTTEEQRRALITATWRTLQPLAIGQAVAGQFWFALQQDVHPMTIGGPCWLNALGQPRALIRADAD